MPAERITAKDCFAGFGRPGIFEPRYVTVTGWHMIFLALLTA